jgi:hypothetical protein
MAENKKKIIVYVDWIEQFKDLTDEESGKLIKHFFAYVNDLNPVSDRLTELLFNPIKATLKRDLLAWEKKQNINRENGSKGGRPKKANETELNPNNPVGSLITQNNPEKGVSDSVSVSVSVKDKDIKDKPFNFKKSLCNYGFKTNLVDDWLKIRKVKGGVNTETAFNKFIAQVEINGNDKNEILETCIEKSWAGFQSDWLKSMEDKNKQNKPLNPQELLDSGFFKPLL